MIVTLMRAPFKLATLFVCRAIPFASTFEIQNINTSSSSSSYPFRRTSLAMSSLSNEVQGPQTFKVLGICGGIGSGKSSASKMMVSKLGCLVHLDADSLAHTVYSPGSQAVKDIVNEFGKEILLEDDGSEKEEIDRKKLGAIVFSDRSEMAKLERLVWPHVKTLLVDRIQGVKSEWEEGKFTGSDTGTSPVPVVILEAAVLLDADWDDILDGVWVITAPREVKLKRLMESRGLSEEECNKRIDAQISRRGIGNLEEEVQKRVVTNVINNSGNEEEVVKLLRAALVDPKSWK